MPARRLTFPAVCAVALACVALGILAALADGRDSAPKAARPAVPVPTPSAPRLLWAVTPRCSPASDKAPAAEPVPQNVLDAFGVLRRPRTADDTLPDEALAALRRRGLEPFDPAAARLLRRTADGGRAWVVPVRDAHDALSWPMSCATRVLTPAAVPPPAPAPGPPSRTRPTPVAPAPVPAAPPAPTPHPGLAVVALGGAPAGAGGRLEDLVRGREEVVLDPCGGPDHDMLSVSGVVPDGVAAVFLTSRDGTAIRADVADNAYAFVVPRAKQPEERYVVWTGGDGTPHVQPLGSPAFATTRVRCPAPTATSKLRLGPVVSPDGSGLCGHFTRVPSANVLYRAPCLVVPPAVPVAPKPVRAPRRHR